MTAGAATAMQRSGIRLSLSAIAKNTWVDLGVLTVLSLIAIVGFEPAFGPYNYLVAGVAGLVVGTAIALAGYLLRLGVLSTIVAGVVAYFALGSPVTMPKETTLAVFPSLHSLSGLVLGAVYGWTDIVTLQTPVEAPPYIAVVPFFATWLIAIVFVSLACRWLPKKPRTPLRVSVLLIGPGALFLAGILLGTNEPYYAGIRGVSFAAIALVWLGWRRTSDGALAITVDSALRRRKLVGVAVVVAVAVVVGVFGGTLLVPATAPRFVLRQQVTPPFDPLQYPSPLAGFRNFTKKWNKTDLFTVSGLHAGEKIRMATMDSYNGQVWRVASPATQTDGSGDFELLGRTIPRPSLFTPGHREKLTFSISGYDDIWLPNVAYTSTLDFGAYRGTDPTTTVRINTTTGAAAVTSGVSAGLVYTVGATTPRIPSDTALTHVPIARIDMPPVIDIPDVVSAKAEEYAGSATSVIQKLRNIERSLKTNGYLSHGLASDPVPSRAGEGADRMTELFSKQPMVGDQEQYASAFALMARHLGYPVRVVMGFAPKVQNGQTKVTVTGNDVTAWDEVAFAKVGWVPFYPTPTKTDAPQEQTTKPKLEPQPQVRQPPNTNQKQDDVLTPVKISDKNPKAKRQAFALPEWAYWVSGIVGGPLIVYFVPFLIIAGLKRRRRRSRLKRGSSDRRAAGSWDELTDGYAELGLTIPPRSTRMQTAAALDAQCADQGLSASDGGLVLLAERTDRAVFSGADIVDEQVDAAWRDADAAARSSRDSAGWLRRRVASFRYRRRSR